MKSVRANTVKIRHWFVLIGLFTLVYGFIGVRGYAQNATIDNEEIFMLRLINDYRAQRGLSQLRISRALTRAADWMSGDMASKNYFSHVDSMGRDPFVRLTAFRYNYQGSRGENLAAGYYEAERTFMQWRKSRGHNANMLNPRYNVIGIGRVHNTSSIYKWYWTTDFGSFVDTIIETGTISSRSDKQIDEGRTRNTRNPITRLLRVPFFFRVSRSLNESRRLNILAMNDPPHRPRPGYRPSNS